MNTDQGNSVAHHGMEETGLIVIDACVDEGLCKELASLHDILGSRGYRPNTEATQLAHVLASGHPHLVLPLLKVRELITSRVQDAFAHTNKFYFLEFTGLLTWLPGSEIGWHGDSNRPYLRQRKLSAVLYLNTQGEGFGGGTFRFQDGPSIKPKTGTLIAYPSDQIHCVDRVESGRRYTLAFWFTDDPAFSEDESLLSRFATGLSRKDCIPDEIYATESGKDMRLEKLVSLGFDHEKSGEDHVLICKESGARASCSNLTEALHLALLWCRWSSSSQQSLSLQDTKQRLVSHNEDLYQCVTSCWKQSMDLGELYVPDKYYNTKLFPDLA